MFRSRRPRSHYCVAAWGTARSLAQATGRKNTVPTMEQALKEGKSLDQKLTEIAEKEITPALLSEDVADEDRSEEQRGQTHHKGSSSRSGRHAPRHS
jgi:hypothetical protein